MKAYEVLALEPDDPRRATERCIVTRDVLLDECPWLPVVLIAGDILWQFHGPTYGCVSPSGTPMTVQPNVDPFFEVPNDAWAPLEASS